MASTTSGPLPSSGSHDQEQIDADDGAESLTAMMTKSSDVHVPDTDGGKILLETISGLKEQQKQAREERKRLAKDLRNAQRRRRRLKAKARQLSNNDLLTVLTMRSEQQEKSATVRKPTSEPGQELDLSKKLKSS